MLLVYSFILFLSSSLSFAKDYFFYGPVSELKKREISFSKVFSSSEERLLKKLGGRVSNPAKINLTPEEITQNPWLKNFKLEKITSARYQGDEFSQYQWGLKNHGHDLMVPIGPTKKLKIKAIKGMDIRLPLAQENPLKPIIVAILDSGVDLNHPDLKEQIYQNDIECEAQQKYNQCLKESPNLKSCHQKWANFDGDKNGYPRDCRGFNVAAPKPEHQTMAGNNKVDDFVGHGTHIAGIIGAKKNRIGVQGVIQNVKLLPVKVSGQEGGLDIGTDIFAKGLLYALNTKAQIINLSFGWQLGEDSLLMREMVKLAHQRGVLLVAAAGNSYHDTPTYPCAYETVVCVSAFSVNGKLTRFANFGPSVDLSAPGQRILSTWPTHLRSRFFFKKKGYEYQSGTSMAAPFVTGALARLLNLGFTAKESKAKILLSANPEQKEMLRFGRLNLKKAVEQKIEQSIVPKSKDFLLFNINQKKLSFKLKNIGTTKQKTTLSLKPINPDIQLSQKVFNDISLDKNEEYEVSFSYQGKLQDPYLDIIIAIQNRNYTIRFEAINPFNPKKSFVQSYSIMNKARFDIKAYLKESFFRTSHNHNENDEIDLIGFKEKAKRTEIILLKNESSHYLVSSKPRVILGTGHIFSKIYKTDLNFDGLNEYVFLSYLKKDKGYQIDFFLFDQAFRPLKKEDFDLNIPEEAIISSQYQWHPLDSKLKPFWIQRAKSPKIKEKKLPWDLQTPNEVRNRLFTVKKGALKEIDLPCSPISFLKRTYHERKDHQLKVLCAKEQSFYYQYKIIHLQKGAIFSQKNIELVDYFSFEMAKMIPDLFHDDTYFIKRTKNSFVFANLNKQTQAKVSLSDPLAYINKVLTVFRFNNQHFSISTSDKFLYFFQNQKQRKKLLKRSNNKNNENFFPVRLEDKLLLYRPSNRTLGVNADLIWVDPFDTTSNSFSRPPQFRFVFPENIREIGVETSNWGQKDTINLLDWKNSQLFKLNLSKNLLDK